MADSLRGQFLKSLLGDKAERKIGEFWIVRLVQPDGSVHAGVETDTIRASRIERERRAKETGTKFDQEGHKPIVKRERERLINSPPPHVTDEELSFIE
jgi:hypothetical protein